MFISELENKYPFLTEYFSSVLNHNIEKVPQSIIFYGQDISSQYAIALELARLLNCSGDKSENCSCLNCKWIREKSHPSVLTVTNLSSKPSGDETETVISIKQAQMIKSSLINFSDYYRVFILCGEKQLKDNRVLCGLNFENFKAEAANSLLKIVEEAPQKTLFIFLTNDKSDVISTIVSRSQVFFVPSFDKQALSFSGAGSIFEDYPNYDTSKLFQYSELFQNALKNYDNLFDKCENYLLSVLKTNPNDNILKQRVIEDIRIFEKSKKMYNLGIKPETICDDMFLALMRR